MKERCFYFSLLITIAIAIAFPTRDAMAKELEGLVLYLPFEEAGDPVDHSPDPAETSVSGKLNLVDGKFGKAAKFNGSSYVEVADEDKLDGMQALTIEVWIQPDTTTNAGIASKRRGHRGEDAYNLFLYTGSKMNARISGKADFWSSTVFEKGKWYHVAYVFDGEAGNQKMYINGVLDSEGVQEHKEVSACSSPLWVGELNDGRGFIYAGLMDELGIWNRALTEEEIELIMTMGKEKMMPVELLGKLAITWGGTKSSVQE